MHEKEPAAEKNRRDNNSYKLILLKVQSVEASSIDPKICCGDNTDPFSLVAFFN